MNNLDMLNSGLLYVLCGGTLVFVLAFAVYIALKVYKRAVEIGVSPDILRSIRKSTIPLVLFPTLGISVGLLALAPALGIPWSSLRISVIGGRGYELMSANMAATSMGYSLSNMDTAGMDVLVNMMLVPAVCILPGLFLLTVFGKKSTMIVQRIFPQEHEFGKIVTTCLSLNMLSVFIPDAITHSHTHILVFITSAAISLVLVVLNKQTHWSWTKQYNSLICLLLGMASGVLYLNL